MQTSNTIRPGYPTYSIWQLLADYPLNKFLPEHDKGYGSVAGLLNRTLLELGLPSEIIENIEMTLTGFARKSLVRFKQGKFELPLRIRVFGQKKKGDEKTKGGWGYFLIERTEGCSDSPTMKSQHFLDLYIYREGE